jgi:uncharacterized protein YjbI with pentapeptide repeats
MREGWKGPMWLCVVVLLLSNGWAQGAWACRLLEPPADHVNTLWVHLDGFCLSADQRELAVKGADVLESLIAGKDLDLHGVLVVGDVMLDQLPLQSVEDLPQLPHSVLARLSQKRLDKVRMIPGAITIQDSQFEKVLATNLVDDVLIMSGAVTISGTTFLQSIDFSKIIFLEPVVFSNVEVGYEGFFIGSDFSQAVDFSHTVFGTHSRFHKAVFRAPVTFAEVQFKGVAEFLEVAFHQGANFSHTKFLSGTGFSGSVFDGYADFSGVRTTQEIYFRFSEFNQGVSFRQGVFPNVVDFSNSQFEGAHDFTGAEFSVKPDFTNSNISVDVPLSRRTLNRQSQWLLFGGLVILAGLYLWITKRRTGGDSP